MGRGPVVVVGGGAAGIMAGIAAGLAGAHAVVLEKTSRPGTKILMSGGGKCNVAHDGPLEDVVRAFRPAEARFLRPSCYRLPNTEIMRRFEEGGVALYTRPNGRVFPADGTAKDVLAVLMRDLRAAGAELRLDTPVLGLVAGPGGIEGVRTPDGVIPCSRAVVACGGSSYPKAGTTGDAWPWLTALGHTIVPVRAALAPVTGRFAGPAVPPGVALRAVEARCSAGGRAAARHVGDVLFTHSGLSGPAILEVSRSLAEAGEAARLLLDVAPDWSEEALASDARSFAASHPRQSVSRWLARFVPESVAPALEYAAGLPGGTKAAQLQGRALNRLVGTLRAWEPLASPVPVLERGEVVAGGVALDEVDPRTMASRIVAGLWLCGELLDVAGPVGGYNLQAAFATGWVAGESAALSER